MTVPASTFDAIVLDLGGVLIKTPARISTNEAIPPHKRYTSTLPWMQYECGEIEETTCYELVGKQFKFDPSELSKAVGLARTTVEYDQEIVSWIRALRKEHPSLKVFAMSNISKPDFDALHTRWGATFWSLFDDIFTSSAAGMRKPNFGFYQHVLKSTGIEPQRIIFVDDKIQNFAAAQSLGMHSILFEDTSVLARTVKNILHDPIVRGKAYLQDNAKQLNSFTDSGVNFMENYVQLLILEATGDEELVILDKPDCRQAEFWNFYCGTPPFGLESLPNDNDTTALALQVVKYNDAIAHSLLDQMLEWMNVDDIMILYHDLNRPRVDAVASVNLCASFYLYQRGHQVQKMFNWVRNVLYHRAYSKGAYYYRCPDWFLFYVNRLLVVTKDPTLAETIGPLLKDRVQERVGLPGDSIALAMRLVVCNSMAVYNYQDFEALKDLQMEDGGWEAGYLYSLPIEGKKMMNRGLGTALAIQALSGRTSKP
ncbi:HAD-superfamily hydrolase subfamily IA variant 3 [Penicillium coprophilum]|uniref:HAD-superfamily hydrolase subfamily IA variant 3 n=1 Tax=Penicillium coprophilum TaxID=36646 RepID=UPI0023924AF8|nr:HAD-superfamily hydrolase subfamily IA variant 3 [Penicillium coprophilum]KAJ5177857.1 HAD-superfamily hydrolase subfamily IA variant 3 [Penicillium coprophilum]